MTQPPVHHNAPPGLRAWLDSVDASREPSVREVTIDGVRCVIKRRRPSLGGGLSYALRYTRALFLGLGCKLFLGEFPAPAWCFGTASSTRQSGCRRCCRPAAACRKSGGGSAACWCWSMWAKTWRT